MKTIEPSSSPVQEGQVWPMSITAYRALGEMGIIPENTELLYGAVYHKMSKSPKHSASVRRLVKLLNELSLHGRFISIEQPISCGNSEAEPDVAVIRGKEDDFWKDHPHTADLAIEVCVTSHDYDRFKLRAYALADVKEVWLILAPEKMIEVHRLPSNGIFTQKAAFGPAGRIQSTAVPEFGLEIESFFRQES